MPDLLSLPRELRDEIYELIFRSSLTLKKAHLPRIRISRKTLSAQEAIEYGRESPRDGNDYRAASGISNDKRLSSPTYYAGEEAIRYPTAMPVPPTDPLLLVNHQIRAEMQETIAEKPVHWNIRLAFRDDIERLYPTWMSMPAFTDHIDTLDVDIRIRKKKTASIFSTTSSIASMSSNASYHWNRNEGDTFLGSLALLQRLLERGPSFVNKKKPGSSRPPMTIGCIKIHLLPKDLEYRREPQELLDDCAQWVDAFLLDRDDGLTSNFERKDDWLRVDESMRFFAERVERLVFEIEGLNREWLTKDIIVERAERTKRREQRQDEENLRQLAVEQLDMMGMLN